MGLLVRAAAVWPAAAKAQPRTPTIGWLSLNSPESYGSVLKAFHQSLGEAGYTEGKNVKVEYRWAGGRKDKLVELAADLVKRKVSLIVASADSAALAAKAATSTIPIVFLGGNDPVKLGLVRSLDRPDSNMTGVINLNIELGPKRVELLHEMLPAGTDFTALVNPANASFASITRDMQATARRLGLNLRIREASNEGQIDAAFENLPTRTMLVIAPDAYYMSQNDKLARLSVHNGFPAIFQTREFTAAGGLASYGTSRIEPYRSAATYVARILNGASPKDLPVQQVTKVELFINAKTAQTLGISLPLTIIGRADEVIE
jgi:putative ABC transport system substrate-binding protein